MIRPVEFPKAREAFFALIDGQEFAGRTVAAYFRLQPDFTDRLPAALIYQVGGSQSGASRLDRLGVDVYGVGTDAEEVAEAICALLTSGWHMTTAGRIDRVTCEQTPHDVPYADKAIRQHSAVYRAATRPI